MYTSHGHHINGTVKDERPKGLVVARCGGPYMCNLCKEEAAAVQARMDGTPVKIEDRPEMLSSGGFIERAKNLVRDTFYRSDPSWGITGHVITMEDVYVVWFTKTLQNWKAIVSTNVKDDMIYEVTYNGDKKETYLDAYHKASNTVVPD